MADIVLSSRFLKSRTWFVVLLFSVISYATNLLMFSMAVWQMRCMKHWVVIIPCNGQILCETVASVVGESWNLVLLSVTVEATCLQRFVLCALCYTAWCFIYLSRRFLEDCGTGCVTDYTVYQDLVMDTSVCLVSYDGLLVKTTTRNCLCLFICVFVLKKNKNLANLVPACRVVSTLLRVEVFVLFLINIPTLKFWFVYLPRHLWWPHLTT